MGRLFLGVWQRWGRLRPLFASVFLPEQPPDYSDETEVSAGASQKAPREGLSGPQEGVGHCPAVRVPLALGDRRAVIRLCWLVALTLLASWQVLVDGPVR